MGGRDAVSILHLRLHARLRLIALNEAPESAQVSRLRLPMIKGRHLVMRKSFDAKCREWISSSIFFIDSSIDSCQEISRAVVFLWGGNFLPFPPLSSIFSSQSWWSLAFSRSKESKLPVASERVCLPLLIGAYFLIFRVEVFESPACIFEVGDCSYVIGLNGFH